ncbi:TPA: aminotransferase class I/II-fold pyridoxal phosphate-dependent enzyme [Streptococcus suis]|uniref:threonine aldolase family protein n=1 Tax=Streptococcus suis TaxID=1307 RepID=UPI00158396FD|nr:aminotransferase class I/II-fold pyridoxal phosphate-dependent enzyme [Streptococcus suis]MCK3889430.1 aminotransferase class I/II-fold pyridoxal phosphate-dependent enzyme [Streptococcus suis]HEM4090583.1 aminotransferase class I/II-fold pyridoxal phosphate-dependent enzyme [Streptococcus suis]HEM4283270.1 aminotransferase class I/II-fold pyridoxal phosphate-dependent enzyme [Streptococcus suis]HEM4597321.1 aminotransferase class I/II-fold pyridoxal phosphate-dependent enzyme [Streptococcus
MLHFENDYNKGAHPVLLEALVASNQEGLSGYGTDCYTQSAIEKIRQAIACPQAQITFLAGGTQTNQIAINSMLASYEGVIAADTGHISTHEAGAIEFSGHKVLTLPHHEGKITANEVDNFIKDFYADANHAHMVHPGMVYISHPTEYGTLYSKTELEDLSKVCQQHNIPLFLDGARLGYGLAARETDLDLKTIAELADVFYIGGTKLGALMGEALVFTKNNQPKNFVSIVKHHGALLAKGRVTGVQFDCLFTDDLYLELGRHAIAMAEQLIQILEEKGFQFYLKSPTNQQFVIVKNEELARLTEAGIAYGFWEKYDDSHSIIRFATSWSTSQADIDELINIL